MSTDPIDTIESFFCRPCQEGRAPPRPLISFITTHPLRLSPHHCELASPISTTDIFSIIPLISSCGILKYKVVDRFPVRYTSGFHCRPSSGTLSHTIRQYFLRSQHLRDGWPVLALMSEVGKREPQSADRPSPRPPRARYSSVLC